MIEWMSTRDRLAQLLRSVPGASEVVVAQEGSKLVAIVVSAEFEGVEEHVRQEKIWRMILDNFSDAEQAEVAYVFTNTPEEKARAQAEVEVGSRD